MNQRSLFTKLTLWAVPVAFLLGTGHLLLGGEFWEIFALWFFLFGIIPKIPGMLFTFPFAIHAHRSLTELPDGRVVVNQGELWQSLRGWIIAWLLLGCVAFAGGVLWAPVKTTDTLGRSVFVWGCYGGIVLLFLLTPLIYQAIVALLIARHCRNYGYIVSGMILVGVSTYVVTSLAMFYLVEISPIKILKFTLPNFGYNPGFPEPESALCYAAILGTGLLWGTIRQHATR